LTRAGNARSSVPMSNVLDQQTQQPILALGRLGWSLRRIETATQVRRETASAYLKAAGIPVRGRGGRATVWPPAKPATTGEVSTDPTPPAPPGRAPSASACEPYPRAHHRGARPGPECPSHLAGPGRRPRLCRALRQCPPLRAAPPRGDAGRGPRGDYHGPWRRSAGRLRRRAHGPRPGHRQVSADAVTSATRLSA